MRYQVTDKENRYVSVTSRTSSSWSSSAPYTGTSLSIPAKVTHDTVEGIERPDKWGDTLQSVTVATESEYLSSLDGVIFNKDKTELLWYPRGKTGTEYNIPASVKVLATNSFANISALQKVVLPEGLERFSDYVFTGCPNIDDINLPSTLKSIDSFSIKELKITSISIPEGITVLRDYVLADCPKLTTVELPSSITKIDSQAFGNCPVLATVTCKAVNPPVIGFSYGQYAFDNTPIVSVTLKVPAGSEDAYRAANVWKDFGNIVEITP